MKTRYNKLRLEVLEDRCVPALNPLTFDAAGNLQITGTLSYDNLILNFNGGDTVNVLDQNTAMTLTKNFGTYAVTGDIDITLGNAVTANILGKGVVINLGTQTMASNIVANLGNVVNINGPGAPGYNVLVSNNDSTGTPQGSVGTIGDNLTINTGAGNDSITVQNINIGTALTSNMGAGNDTFVLQTTGAIATDMSIGTNVSVSNVNNLQLNSNFPLTAVHIGGNVTTTAENNSFGNSWTIGDLFTPLQVEGSMFMTTGTTGIFLTQINVNAQVGGGVTANCGQGNNAFTIDAASVVLGKLTYVGGNGNNHVTLASGSVIADNVGVFVGNGTNTFDFNDIVLGNCITYLGGTHANTVNLSGQATGAATKITEGAGTNTLNLTAGLDIKSLYMDWGHGLDTFNPGSVIFTWPVTFKNF